MSNPTAAGCKMFSLRQLIEQVTLTSKAGRFWSLVEDVDADSFSVLIKHRKQKNWFSNASALKHQISKTRNNQSSIPSLIRQFLNEARFTTWTGVVLQWKQKDEYLLCIHQKQTHTKSSVNSVHKVKQMHATTIMRAVRCVGGVDQTLWSFWRLCVAVNSYYVRGVSNI